MVEFWGCVLTVGLDLFDFRLSSRLLINCANRLQLSVVILLRGPLSQFLTHGFVSADSDYTECFSVILHEFSGTHNNSLEVISFRSSRERWILKSLTISDEQPPKPKRSVKNWITHRNSCLWKEPRGFRQIDV